MDEQQNQLEKYQYITIGIQFVGEPIQKLINTLRANKINPTFEMGIGKIYKLYGVDQPISKIDFKSVKNELWNLKKVFQMDFELEIFRKDLSLLISEEYLKYIQSMYSILQSKYSGIMMFDGLLLHRFEEEPTYEFIRELSKINGKIVLNTYKFDQK